VKNFEGRLFGGRLFAGQLFRGRRQARPALGPFVIPATRRPRRRRDEEALLFITVLRP
jgi:hypothetical protein